MNISNEFLSLMNKGGPIMWVIFVAATIAMIMIFWQAIHTYILCTDAQADYHNLRNNYQYVPDFGNSPVTQIINRMDWQQVNNQDDLIKEINIYLSEITTKLEGVLPTIATLGTLLPMLGLLGTVTGMINVFEVIAVHGSGKPDEMAFGISQALLTTASGLIFAIPVIFIHHLLTKKANNLMTITGQSVQIIMNRDLNIYKARFIS